MQDITLQINLSPGDIAYAALTVPALVQAHRANVVETVAIVDCCRPSKTKIVDPDQRFPLPVFQQRVEQICAIAETLKTQGWIDQIVYLHPNNDLQPLLAKKYLANWVNQTHDYGGCALMAYLAAFEVISTRYLLHYDADMLLYQALGYDWAVEAVSWLEQSVELVAATPRPSPTSDPDALTLQERLPLIPSPGGWRNQWFSTRCYLIDRTKLEHYLPLIRGKFLLETLAVRWLNRGYPRSPELMLFRGIGDRGGWRLNLKSEKAWLLHPVTKPPRYLELLPEIQRSIQLGQVPTSQRGYVDINLDAWEQFLEEAHANSTHG